MEEVWKDVKDYQRIYQVSNTGKVRRLKGSPMTKDNRILVNKTKSSGYKFVCLSVESLCKYYHVHRLVAEAFIDNPENKKYVNHIDCDKSNNNVENLEWVTAKENSEHARKNIIFNYNNKIGIENKSTKQIVQKDLDGNYLYLWDCVKNISSYYSIVETAINRACRNNTISIGFMWKYIDKKFYFLNKDSFLTPPKSIVKNKRDRDLTKAHLGRKLKSESITDEDLLQIGIDCFNEYGNIYRTSLEEYARNNNKKSYGFIVKRFATFKNFQELVRYKIQSPLNNIKLWQQ